MNKGDLKEMNKVVQTNYVMTELAKIEMNTKRVFTDEELRKTASRSEMNEITRTDLNFAKALINNKEYSSYLDKINVYCKRIKAGECSDKIKEKLLDLIEKKDNIYNTVKKVSFKQKQLI